MLSSILSTFCCKIEISLFMIIILLTIKTKSIITTNNMASITDYFFASAVDSELLDATFLPVILTNIIFVFGLIILESNLQSDI
jgi:hypothetical protein